MEEVRPDYVMKFADLSSHGGRNAAETFYRISKDALNRHRKRVQFK